MSRKYSPQRRILSSLCEYILEDKKCMEHTLPLLVLFVLTGTDNYMSTLVLLWTSQIKLFLTQIHAYMAFTIKLLSLQSSRVYHLQTSAAVTHPTVQSFPDCSDTMPWFFLLAEYKDRARERNEVIKVLSCYMLFTNKFAKSFA